MGTNLILKKTIMNNQLIIKYTWIDGKWRKKYNLCTSSTICATLIFIFEIDGSLTSDELPLRLPRLSRQVRKITVPKQFLTATIFDREQLIIRPYVSIADSPKHIDGDIFVFDSYRFPLFEFQIMITDSRDMSYHRV